MHTRHRPIVGDAREMTELSDDSVELVVTSPPYPMIELWDETFTALDPAVDDALASGDGDRAFEAMHETLDAVWEELQRVLIPGGIACINIGDATRTIDGSFRVYQNHARIIDAFRSLGFQPLPDILWRKPTNSHTKFMGSGMLPPNAYVTLEHEYVLIFRNGSQHREFEPGSSRRYESAYFWEERNQWFSDVWTDVAGEGQLLEHDDLRERTAAYPLSIPYRLINMYSIYGDTVLDPFWGTGTTSLAAIVAARNSVGIELEASFREVFDDRLDGVEGLSRRLVDTRLENHREFVAREGEDSLAYDAVHYDTSVRTKQEREIRLYAVDAVSNVADGYLVEHVTVEP